MTDLKSTDKHIEVITQYFLDRVNRPGSYIKSYYYWKKFRNISDLFKNEVNGKNGVVKVLDVGCGVGTDIFRLNRIFSNDARIEFYGLDLNPWRIHFCNLIKKDVDLENVEFGVGSADELNFPNGSFDIILSVEVLEHLKTYDKALKEFYRVLKPGGLAIITTPNEGNLVSKLKGTFSFLRRKDSEADKQCELDDTTSLESNCEEVGFGHIAVKGINEWFDIFREHNFMVEKVKRGSILYGTPAQDKHRASFALILFAEVLLDKLNLWKTLSEDIIVSLRKI